MPVGEIAGEILGGILRLLGYFLAETVFEVLIKGAGYFICRLFCKRVNPDGIPAVFVGMLFWCLVLYLGFVVYSFIAQQVALGNCLDMGGKFNDINGACEGVSSSGKA